MKKLKFNADEKVNEIFRTSDYEKFKTIAGNRRLNQNKINKLVKSMKKKNWLATVEITVNQYYQVIDGQHRLEAAKIARVPVLYKIVEDTDLTHVIETNQGASNWTLKDHLPSQINMGNKDYILLDRFMKEFPKLNMSICQMLLTQTPGNPNREKMESGLWNIKDYNTGVLWGQHILSLEEYFEGYYRVIFVRGMITVLNNPKFNFQEFVHKVQLRPNMLVPCGSTKQYVAMIEEIYNYKRADKVNLRF
jgi:hypothetical protein